MTSKALRMIEANGRPAALRSFAKAAILALPLVSLPAPAQVNGFTNADTACTGTKSAVQPADTAGMGAHLKLIGCMPARQPAAADSTSPKQRRAPAGMASVIQLEDPALVRAGDTVASYRVLYVPDSSGIPSYFHAGWVVQKVRKTGIWLAPFICRDEFLGERMSLDPLKIAERIDYGGSRTISMGIAADSLVGGPLRVWAAKNRNGSAAVAVRFVEPAGAAVPYSIERVVVSVGSEVDRFGKVSAINEKGVEFTGSAMPWEGSLRAAMRAKDSGACAADSPRPRFVRFGESYTVGHYCNSTALRPKWGTVGFDAAFIEIIREGEQKK